MRRCKLAVSKRYLQQRRPVNTNWGWDRYALTSVTRGAGKRKFEVRSVATNMRRIHAMLLLVQYSFDMRRCLAVYWWIQKIGATDFNSWPLDPSVYRSRVSQDIKPVLTACLAGFWGESIFRMSTLIKLDVILSYNDGNETTPSSIYGKIR